MDRDQFEERGASRPGEPPPAPESSRPGDPSSEAWLDEALEETFPASDPIAPFHRTARGAGVAGSDRDDRRD